MIELNYNILIVIIAAAILIAVIYYFNNFDDKSIPHNGTGLGSYAKPRYEYFTNEPNSTTRSNDIIDDLVSQYSMNEMLPTNYPYAKYDTSYVSPDKDDTNDFVYKKQKFTKKNIDDIMDLYDVSQMLPKETDEDWFDTSIIHNPKKIMGTNFIDPKVHMGTNASAGCKKNAAHDIRGDILIPKIDISPWGNSTIERDKFQTGVCDER